MTKKKPRRCIKCNEPLNNFIAYVPDEGEECLKCYTEYAKSKEFYPRHFQRKIKNRVLYLNRIDLHSCARLY